MSARVVRRLTLVLAAVVLLLVAQEGKAVERGGSGNTPSAVAGMVVEGAGSETAAAAAGQCGNPIYDFVVCLEWEPCPALEDLLAFCDAKAEVVCPGWGYLAHDAECYDTHSHGDEGLWCWLITGDPSWVGCYVHL